MKKIFLLPLTLFVLLFASCKTDVGQGAEQRGETGSLTVSTAAVNESASRSLYISDIKSAIVTVRGYGADGAAFEKNSGLVTVTGGSANGITVTDIPVCSNAVVAVQAYKNIGGTSLLDGGTIYAVTDIERGNNTVSVNWESSKKGIVYNALLLNEINTDTLTEENLSSINNAIPSDTHAFLIDASSLAKDFKSSSLKASSSYKLTAGSVNVTCNDYDGCTLQLCDPISSTATASTSSPVTISNAAPGTWKLYVLNRNTVETTKTVTVTSGGTSNVTVGEVVVDDRIIVHWSVSSNKQKIYAWSTDGKDIKYTGEWSGSAASDEDSDGYYDYTLNYTSSNVIFNDGNGSQTGDLKISSAGEYWWLGTENGNDSDWSTINPNTPIAPSINISPSDGSKVAANGKITVTINPGNDTITTASVSIKELSASWSYNDFTNNKLEISLSTYSLNAGDSLTVTASAANSAGSCNESASLTVKEANHLVSNPNELRIYQVMVASFQDGDSNIGYTQMWGPDNALKGGDLQGIINAVDYIKNLGCNALWMTPIFQSNTGEEKLKATGYFANDYFNVDNHFGTNEKFAELVEACHEKEIAVILDGVFGHNAGYQLVPSPNRSGIKNPGITPSSSNPVDYAGNENSLKYYSDVARYWITEYKIDGWRFDQCYQVGLGDKSSTDNTGAGGHNYWYDIRKVIEAASASNGTKGSDWGTLGYLVGEHWNGDQTRIQAGSVASGSAAGYGLNGCFDFPAYYQFVQGFACEYGNKSKSTGNITTALSYLYKTYKEKGYSCLDDDGTYDIYYPNFMLSNHDLYRIGDVLKYMWNCGYDTDEYTKRNKVLLAAQCAYTGPITIYYGDEIGDHSVDLNGWGGDNVARSSGKITGFNTREQTLHDWTQKCLEARADHEALWNGTNQQITGQTDFYVSKKVGGGETIYIAFNYNTSSSKTFSASGKDLLTGTKYSGTVTVPALSAVYLLAE